MSSLLPLLPGTTALDFSRSARVSIDSEPLYLPLVWHSAQRDLMMGTTSWAKSTGFASRAAHGSAPRARAATAKRHAGRSDKRRLMTILSGLTSRSTVAAAGGIAKRQLGRLFVVRLHREKCSRRTRPASDVPSSPAASGSTSRRLSGRDRLSVPHPSGRKGQESGRDLSTRGRRRTARNNYRLQGRQGGPGVTAGRAPAVTRTTGGARVVT